MVIGKDYFKKAREFMTQQKVQEIVEWITIESKLDILKDLRKVIVAQYETFEVTEHDKGWNAGLNQVTEYIDNCVRILTKDDDKGQDYVEF